MNLVSSIKKTSRDIKRAMSVGGEYVREDDMDILDKLKQEHEEAGELLKKLTESKNGTERKALLKKLKGALVPHLRAEGQVVYDAVNALKDKELKQDAQEGYLEHDLAEKTLVTLGKITNATSPEFSAAAKVLKELVEHHVEEEERDIWSDVRDNFSADQRLEMNRRFEAAKKKVRLS